jgi:hypothetical protein
MDITYQFIKREKARLLEKYNCKTIKEVIDLLSKKLRIIEDNIQPHSTLS